MTKCDVCGRATFKTNAVTFPNNDVVVCRRASCEPVGNACKLRYYEEGRDGVMDIINREAIA